MLEETTVIPAQAEMEVYVCAKDLEGQSGVWLLEDCLAQSSKQVAVAARTLVAPSRRLVTRLINPTKTATVIRKGSKVAVLSKGSKVAVLSQLPYIAGICCRWVQRSASL